MTVRVFNRMVFALVIGALPLSGTARLAQAQNEKQQQRRDEQDKQKKNRQDQQQEKERRRHQQAEQQAQRQAQRQAREQEQHQKQQEQQQQREQARQQQLQQQKRRDAAQGQRQQERQQRQQARPEQLQREQATRRQREQARQGRPQRLPQERQQELIAEQRNRATRYRQDLQQQESVLQERAQALRQSHRLAQYRFQEDYLRRIRQQRVRLESRQSYDYGGDPYYYTPASYRYYREGSYYETNQYGADVLRRALDYGYEEGFRTGRADHDDRWGNGYEDSYAFRDANYGYNGEYVDQREYNYYFREGFQRGYEDGVNSRYRYGRRANGKYVLIASVLAQLLNLQALN